MDPRTPLPSFLELSLVDATVASGRAALNSSIDTVAAKALAAAHAAPLSAESSRIPLLKAKLATIFAHVGMKYRPELALLVTYLIERSFLKSCGATASESMYGMRRAKVVSDKVDQRAGESGLALRPVTDGDKARSALLTALGPYLKEKLDQIYERKQRRRREAHRWRRDDPRAASRPTNRVGTLLLRERLDSSFLMLYPFLHAAHEGTILAYRFMYLLGQTVYYGPGLHLLRLLVRRVTQADLQKNKAGFTALAAKPSAAKISGDGAANSAKRPGTLEKAMKVTQKVALVCAGSIVIATLINHFRVELRRRRRQWMAGEEHFDTSDSIVGVTNPSAHIRLPPPQPPELLAPSLHPAYLPLPSDPSLCPICRQTRLNPTASTSGYIFCHRCLVMWIREHGERCPLTGMRCPEERLLRIYEPTSARS